MNILAAADVLIDITNQVGALMAAAKHTSGMIAQAQAEGRSDFTAAEWATIKAPDDAARAQLAADLAAA